LRLPLARLLQLVMILQTERFPNVRRLAEACAVSRRTIYRDLTILETAGLSIVYMPEQQGYQLGRECLLQPPQLDEREALAILMLSRFGSIPDPFGSLLPARGALAKVVQALPIGVRDQVADCGELLPEGATPPDPSPERLTIYEAVLSALSTRRRLRLWAREHALGAVSTTDLGVYQLAKIQGQWALVGHSLVHNAVRLFWLAWLEAAELTGEPYAIPPRFRLKRFLNRSQPGRRDRLRKVHLRFSASVAPVIRDMPLREGQMQFAGPDGTIDVFMMVQSVNEIVSWVLGYADQVEVIQPAELRNLLRDLGERIVRQHSPDGR
jgi:proteasome accessory factor B